MPSISVADAAAPLAAATDEDGVIGALEEAVRSLGIPARVHRPGTGRRQRADRPDLVEGPSAEVVDGGGRVVAVVEATRGPASEAAEAAQAAEADHRALLQLASVASSTVQNLQRLHAERGRRLAAEQESRRRALLADVQRVLTESLELERTLDALVTTTVPVLADVLLVHLLEGRTASLVRAFHADRTLEDSVRQLVEEEVTIDRPEGVGAVLRTGEPRLLLDPHRELAGAGPEQGDVAGGRRLAVGSALCVPLRARGRVIGALTLGRVAGEVYNGADLAFAEELAERAALAVDNALSYETARGYARELERLMAQQERLETLLVGKRQVVELIAAAFPLEAVLTTVVRLVEAQSSHELAGAILVVEGEHLRLAAGPSLPADLMTAIDGLEVGAAMGGPGQAAATGQPTVVEHLEVEPAAGGPLTDLARAAAVHGFRTCWSVPIRRPGASVVATFTAFLRDRGPTTAQEDLVDMVLRDVELAIERHRERQQAEREAEARRRAFEERDRVARVLQQSLLPPDEPAIPGFELAGRYRPGTLEVGGDFYDVFPVRGPNWGIVIGDVCGKGPEAATLTALARHSLRAAAMTQPRTGEVLRTLNESLHRGTRDPGRFCSAVFARLRKRRHTAELHMASAGHPPVLVLRADGTVEWLPATGPLLGIFDEVEIGSHEVELGPGDQVIFYTDGLTEARGRAGDLFGTHRLEAIARDSANLAAERLASRLEEAVDGFHRAQTSDDLAILVLRLPATTNRGSAKAPRSSLSERLP